jgi:hypothetical protein
MMSFSIQMTDEEQRLASSYAKLHALSLTEAFKRALFEKIEDEYDAAVGEAAYAEYLKNPVTYSHAEMKEMLGL